MVIYEISHIIIRPGSFSENFVLFFFYSLLLLFFIPQDLQPQV